MAAPFFVEKKRKEKVPSEKMQAWRNCYEFLFFYTWAHLGIYIIHLG